MAVKPEDKVPQISYTLRQLRDAGGLIKLGVPDGNELRRHTYGNTWMVDECAGPKRIAVAASANHVDLLLALARTWPPGYALLYVLVESRLGHRRPGRYQSRPTTSFDDIEKFCTRYREYLETDGRHHLWIISSSSAATIAYDNHNIIYAYGDLDAYAAVLGSKGLDAGQCAVPQVHVHCRHPRNDYMEDKVTKMHSWMWFPLQPMDEQ